MKDENQLYWIWLSLACGAASKDFGRLCSRYENPFDLYRLEEDEIEHLDGIAPVLKERLCDKSLNQAYAIMRYCKANKVDIISYGDKRYPNLLRSLEDPPVLLYCLGKFPDMNKRIGIAMVGTRRMSPYGAESAYRFGYELAAANVVVVSGMALGVDAASACGVLEAGGTTVAVLGCGISRVYPKEHKKLMAAIAKHGAVVTEYPPNERPNSVNFPKRNRLISGMCHGTLIVEAPKRSGALITAALTVSQGRDLFALPGQVDILNSEGPNDLIRDGANVVLQTEDMVDRYAFLYTDAIDYGGLSKAKKHSAFHEGVLKKYGVSDLYYKGRYQDEDEPSPKPKTSALQTKSNAQRNEESKEKINGNVPRAEATKTPEAAPAPDHSERALAGVDDLSRRVFALMPLDRAVTPDELANAGIAIGDVITSLTILEISGVVSALPGGMYVRK